MHADDATPENAGQTPQIELVEVQPPALVLRDFDFRLRPQYDAAGAVHGIALDVLAKVGLPVQLTMMFERVEFVNLATAGLAGLDEADNTAAGADAGGAET